MPLTLCRQPSYWSSENEYFQNYAVRLHKLLDRKGWAEL